MLKQIPENYQPDNKLLDGRTILITGASDGIGAAAARSYAAFGATVILLGRSVKKLEKVYDQIVDAGHPQPAIYPMDLEGAQSSDYYDLANTIEQEFSVLDGLLHNAARLDTLMPLEQYDLKLWARLMQINLNAPFLLTHACLPLLKKSADASVMFTSSRVAHHGRAYWGAYGVSKAGCDNLMQILADEVENNTNIRANSIDPGAVRTRLRRQAYPGEDASLLPAPEDIMPAYLYLMGPDSKKHTGEIFSV
ncbi:MAG TPA: YciK family oxidoreductase [Gammaproteobacteria bacterium]|nr:YciK family oxidoreductase [Gammaproteobacteria bacterium]